MWYIFIFLYIYRTNKPRGRNRGDIMRQKSNNHGAENEVRTNRRPEIDARFLLIQFECGRLQEELVIFSDPLCSLSIFGCLNTEEPLLLLRVAAFISGLIWRFPLILLYGNQSTSNPDHLSQRYTSFVLDRELTWAGLQRAEVALL